MADNDTAPAPLPSGRNLPKVANQVTPSAPPLTEAQQSAEEKLFARRLAKDDENRDKADRIEVVAICSFHMVEDHEDPELVQAGQTITISAFDLPRMAGKVRPKTLDAAPGTAIVQQA